MAKKKPSSKKQSHGRRARASKATKTAKPAQSGPRTRYPELAEKLNHAAAHRHMLAIYWIEDNQVHLWRLDGGIPPADFATVVKLLRDDLAAALAKASQQVTQVDPAMENRGP